MKQFSEEKGTRYRGASMGVFWPGQDAEIIFGEQYDNTFYATACAYLLRRFGPAQWGCDSYKDLTQYILTTQMDGVLLTVRPCCSVSTSFGYLLNPEIHEKNMDAEFASRKKREKLNIKQDEVCGPVDKALCGAMEELKTPVNVRDWFFNITGRVRDDDLQNYELLADYSNLAGYGITPEYFDKFKERDSKDGK